MKRITKTELDFLAEKYETEEFIHDDPIRVPRRFFDCSPASGTEWFRNVEIAAVIASWMAYGSRKVFMKKTDEIFEVIGDSPSRFITDNTDGFSVFRNGSPLYRLYRCSDLADLCARLKDIYSENGSIYDFIQKSDKSPLDTLIGMFMGVKGFPKGKDSACKRLCMLLRWMTRDGSPVDMGMWRLDKSSLVIPLDVHVLRMASRLGITDRRSYSMSTAIAITETLKEFDMTDPVRYDFALYGADRVA